MTLRQIVETLKHLVEQLEDDVQRTTKDICIDEKRILLDKTRDYHYQEILGHLKQIKAHVEVVKHHDSKIKSLQDEMKSGTFKVDKNYIKKQVEVFQSINDKLNVPRRVKKPPRTSDSTSMVYLATWEKFLDKQEMMVEQSVEPVVEVKKREMEKTAVRKNKKFVSSTFDTFLDNKAATVDSDEETVLSEAKNAVIIEEGDDDELGDEVDHEEEVEDTTPRIVDVIYKTINNVISHDEQIK